MMSESSGRQQSSTRMSIGMGSFITAALSPGGHFNYTRMPIGMGSFITAAFLTREEVPLLGSTIYMKLEDREVSSAAPPFSIMEEVCG